MSYIIKKNDPMVNVKLTNKGRRNLSSGALSFINFTLGDGEMDYTSSNPTNVNILRPADSQHDIQYPVPSSENNYKNTISIKTSIPLEVHTTAKERGFFIYNTGGTVDINTDLCTAAMLTGSTSSNNTKISLSYFSGSTKNNTHKTTIDAGDFIFIKFKTSGYTSNYTDVTHNRINIEPIQYEMYNIVSVNSGSTYNLTGYTTGTTIEFELDRSLPKYDSYIVDGFIYPGANTISDYYDNPTPTAYWQEGTLDFTTGSTPTADDVPVWNMNIVTLEDIIGLDSTIYKGKYSAKSKKYWGTAINYDYFLKIEHNKIGIVHYTNNSVSNFYGEGFFRNTFKLKIPYIMWHKKQFGGVSLGDSIGYTFISDTIAKYMGANNSIKYYDLIDQEIIPTVVGKILIDEKIVLIEDQELLSVMSYKANRNWSLPKPKLTPVNPGVCASSSAVGAIQPNEAIHVSYLFLDTSGTTGLHCENYSSVYNTGKTPQDVVFEFPKSTTDPTYTELGYLMSYSGFTGTGFRLNSVILLWQKTDVNARPSANAWNYYNVNNYVGTNGCLTSSNFQTNTEYFGLYTEVMVGEGSFTIINSGGTNYSTITLAQKPIGDLFVASGTTLTLPYTGNILSAAPSLTGITTSLKYYVDTNTTVWFKRSDVSSSTHIQLNYITGTTTTSAMIKQQIVVPSSYSGLNYINGIYTGITGNVCLTLNEIPNNNVVWLFYNGQLVNSAYYGIIPTGTTSTRRIELTFTPTVGSNITYFYIDESGLGLNPIDNKLLPININNLRVNIDKSLLDISETQNYNLNSFISLPSSTNINGLTFGDEVFFYGNIETDIKATLYKTVLTCNVLPNQYINSANPTFNSNDDKVSFTEIGIYDNNDDLVAIGKFSEPLVRKYNSDMLIIQATIDF